MTNFSAEQAAALLLGLAAGDALGVPVEFEQRGSFHVTGMQGCGTHGQPPGTWSDDTSLALCLADSLSRGYDLAGIARNFVKWYDEAAFTARGITFGVGGTTEKALLRLKAGIPPAMSGSKAPGDNGNGSLMRAAPLVFLLAGKREAERFKITRDVSSITHAHPWSVAACCIYLEYLLKLLSGMDKRAAYTALQDQFLNGSPHIKNSTLAKFDRILRYDLSAEQERYIKSGGFVIDTLEAAFWCFLTTDTCPEAVLKAVNLGDDADTTAAVTGGLAGLYYGLESIPEDWLKTLARQEDIRALAEGIFRKYGGTR